MKGSERQRKAEKGRKRQRKAEKGRAIKSLHEAGIGWTIAEAISVRLLNPGF